MKVLDLYCGGERMGYLKINEDDEVMCPARRRMIDKVACLICVPAWQGWRTEEGVFCRYPYHVDYRSYVRNVLRFKVI